MSTKSGESKVKGAVFDTNVLISAYLWPGVPRKALEIARQGKCELFSSKETIREFVRVLGYSKFGFTATEIAPFVDDLTSLVTLIHPRKTIKMISDDPTDDLFISIAVEANCSYIVSGDRHLLKLIDYQGIKIVTPSQFVQRAKAWSVG